MPHNLWNDQDAANLPDLEGLVYRSNLLGRDRAVVNIYGGNTSTKLRLTDHLGREVEVLAVKASGSDVATIKAHQFALLRMDEIEPLYARESMMDEAMVAYLERTWFEPGRPRQSIETLLHAFVPHKHVDHTHPDAVISLMCVEHAEDEARKVYGDRVAYVPYIRPGFTLSQWIGGKVRDNPKVECVVMGKHGLVTWGPDSKTSYETTIRIIQETEDYIADRRKGKKVFGDLKVPGLSAAERLDLMTEVLPVIRGAVSSRKTAILQYDGSDTVLDMVGGAKTGTVSQIGAACPDHLVHVKRQPLFVDWQPSEGVAALKSKVRAGIADYEARYVDYFHANKHAGDELRDAAPRVILIPGLGMVNTGKDRTNADVSRQLYHRAIHVIGAAEALGGFISLTPNEAYNIEYWPLELYKLKLAPPDRDFAGKVVLITGGASSLGRATAKRLAQDGAHVMIADTDDTAGEILANELQTQYGAGRAQYLHADATHEAAGPLALRQTILKYGGLDGLITASIPMARAAVKVMEAQGIGGAVVFVGAAELDSVRDLVTAGGPLGIRVNAVLPGVQAEPGEVAEAIAFLAEPRSRKITGTVLPVGSGH